MKPKDGDEKKTGTVLSPPQNDKEIKDASKKEGQKGDGFSGAADTFAAATNIFSNTIKGADFTKIVSDVEALLASKGKAGKGAAAGLGALRTTIEISDTARESYRGLAEAVATSTGELAGSFTAAEKSIDTFSEGLTRTAQATGQSTAEITEGVRKFMNVSSDISRTFDENATAQTKAAAAFDAYTQTAITARNVGIGLETSLQLTSNLFSQQGQTIENMTDPMESSLGLMRAMSEAIKGTGMSMGTASRFISDTAKSYEYLNWSSRKTALTLGVVSSFAKENKDVFKSADQAVTVYGNALQGTAAAQMSLDKATFFGTMGQVGGKMGLEAALEFEDLEGPDALKSVTDTITKMTGGKLLTKEEARAQGGAGVQQYYTQRRLIQGSLGLAPEQAKAFQESAARGLNLGDLEAQGKAQSILKAGGTEGAEAIAKSDADFKKQLYSSTQTSNEYLASIRENTKAMASKVVAISPDVVGGVINKTQATMEANLPAETKQILGKMQSKSSDAVSSAAEVFKSGWNKVKDFTLDLAESGREKSSPITNQTSTPSDTGTNVPPTPSSSTMAKPSQTSLGTGATSSQTSLGKGTNNQVQLQAKASPKLDMAISSIEQEMGSSIDVQQTLAQGNRGKTQQIIDNTTKPGSTSKQTKVQSQAKPEPIKNLGKVPLPKFENTEQNKQLAFNAASSQLFTSGLDPNLVGTILGEGSTDYQFGYAMPTQGLSTSGGKTGPLGTSSTDPSVYEPEFQNLPSMPEGYDNLSTTTITPISDLGMADSQNQVFSAKTPSKAELATKLQNQVKGLVSKSNIDLVNKYSDTTDPQQKAALQQLGRFMTLMKNKNPADIPATMKDILASGSQNATFNAQKASASAKEQGNAELANLLDQWESTFSTGRVLSEDTQKQAGFATSTEKNFLKTTTTKTGFDTTGLDLTSPTKSGQTDKYIAPSKGNALAAMQNIAQQKMPITSSSPTRPGGVLVPTTSQFQAAADMNIPQLDSKPAQAAIMEKNKKDSQAAAVAKTSASSPTGPSAAPAVSSQSSGMPLMAQIVLNVNGNALMETLIQTTAFEKGVQTQVAAKQTNTPHGTTLHNYTQLYKTVKLLQNIHFYKLY